MSEWTARCPTCWKDGHLHHDRVTVFSRKEDANPDVTVVDVPDTNNAARPDLPENPSERRSGVVIEGWCEGCEWRWLLTVSQHKGDTMISVQRKDAEIQAQASPTRGETS